MSKMLSPMELYHAARETCVRLYVANGGDRRDRWTIKPFPGTAAISKRGDPYGGVSHWTLCMPSFPLDIRLPRWKADLIAAYTVHELLHALWTDWDVVKQSRIEGLHSLCNALEDNRIEAKANTPALVMVTEARRLLEALNAHIAKRALTTAGFTLDDPKQFSFVLNLVLFAEKHRYVSTLPTDWRARVRPEWLPMFDMALARFDALRSTGDVLQLARDLKAFAATMPKPSTPKVKINAKTLAQSEEDDSEAASPEGPPPMPMPEGPPPMPMPAHDREITEPEAEADDDNTTLGDLTGGDEPEASEDDESVAPDLDDAEKPADGQGPGEPVPPTPGMEDAPGSKSERESKDDNDLDAEPEGLSGNDAGGRGGATSDDDKPEPEQPAEDVTDGTQVYDEAHLDDLAAEAAKDAGKSAQDVYVEASHASTILNVPEPRSKQTDGGGDPKRVSAIIASPAKLRRHLTMAVKSPERVANERRQVSGRLDMRNLVGLATGAPNVFRRRVEEEGREAAVSILIDISGSMAGERLNAAKAMALHMGDGLKAAGVKFEIAGFDDVCVVRPKQFSEGWAEPTRRKIAGLRTLQGTGMLPAMKAQAERLIKVGNVTRRILLVLTDGQDSYAADANAALCTFYAGRGVEIIGIGLMTHSVVSPFKGKATVVWDCRTLATDGLKALVKLLDAGAPRASEDRQRLPGVRAGRGCGRSYPDWRLPSDPSRLACG